MLGTPGRTEHRSRHDVEIDRFNVVPTRDDVRRAEQIARDRALESQALTDQAYQGPLRRLVDLRLDVGADGKSEPRR